MVQRCLACGSSGIENIIDFGHQPAANLLPNKRDEAVEYEDLALDYCLDCGHAQQRSFYAFENLFTEYLYQSGTSNTLKKYFDWLSSSIAKGTREHAKVLEIASNDGSCLSKLIANGLDSEGVEPARNIAKISQSAGHKVHVGFWPVQLQSKYDVILAQNVAAHTPDPFSFMLAVFDNLKDDGVAYVQSSQVDMFANFEFDTLYHEHFSFYCANSKRILMERAGFANSYFIKTNIHGGSLLGIFTKRAESLERAISGFDSSSGFFLGEVKNDVRPSLREARGFADRAQETCESIRQIINTAKNAGMQVALIGAAAKAITVLQVADLHIDSVFDEAPLKLGRYIPGTDLEIEPLANVANIPEDTLFVIGAWNFKDELTEKIKTLRNSNNSGGDVFLSYFPRVSLT